MSTNSVSLGNNPFTQGPQSAAFQQRKQDFSALQSALNSGDLNGAKTAFASLQQDSQSIRQARGGQGPDQDGDNDGSKGSQASGSQGKQDFTALQNALSSGDLKGAQQAFASLQQDMQAKSQGHHHHHHSSSGSTSGSTSATATTSQVGTINTTA